jgi:hypothetical protein
MGNDQLKRASKLRGEPKDTVAKAKKNGSEFLLQELAMGLTFAQLAKDSRRRGQLEDADRQKTAAIESYQTALKSLSRSNPTPPQKRQIEADLAELEFKLKALGV